MARGGKREGAGRKKCTDKKAVQSFTLGNLDIGALNKLSEHYEDMSKSQIVGLAIQNLWAKISYYEQKGLPIPDKDY